MNCPHKCPSPEVMVAGKDYAFSYNPDMLIDSKDTGPDYCLRARRFMVTNMKLRYASLDIIPEISSQGRIHYHGRITISSIVPFFLEDIPVLKKHGTYEIDHISDEDKWTVYVMKFFEVYSKYWSDYCPKEKSYAISTYPTGTQWKLQKFLDAKRRITEAATAPEESGAPQVSKNGSGSEGVPRLKSVGPYKKRSKIVNILGY